MENMRITFVPLSQFKPTPGPLSRVSGHYSVELPVEELSGVPTCLSVLVKELSTQLYFMFPFDDITVDLSLCYKLIYSGN